MSKPDEQAAVIEALQQENQRLAATVAAHEVKLRRLAQQAALRSDLGAILMGGGPLREILQRATEAVVGRLDAAFARIWLYRRELEALELVTSAGILPRPPGAAQRIPLGRLVVGYVGEVMKPYMTQDAPEDPKLAEMKECLITHGLTSMAAMPMVVDGRLVGVMAMFATSAIPEDTFEALSAIADALGQGVERKLAEEALFHQKSELRRQNALLARIILNAPIGMIFIAPDMTVRWATATLLEAMGVDEATLVGRPVLKAFPAAPSWLDEALAEVIASGRPYSRREVSFGIRRVSHWDITLQPIFEEDGELLGVLGLGLEVSERVEKVRLQGDQLARLREVDRLKNDFLNAASHELRTPLMSIMGYAEFLEDGVAGELSLEQREFVAQIQAGSLRLQRLVDDMLDFARLEAGRFELVRQETELASLLRMDLASLVPQAHEKRVALAVEEPLEPMMVHADPRRISQVLLNLIGNAIKFTPPGGRVGVAAERREDKVRVVVTDTGIGIAPEHQERLFEKFYQVDPSMTRAHGGAGLGLAIARGLIEAHGGAIGVESSPGAGSTFWFTLPAS